MKHGLNRQNVLQFSRIFRFVKYTSVFIAALAVVAMPVYAAAQKEQISTVKLTVSCNPKPEAGKEIGSVAVTQTDGRISITEPAYYYDTDEAVWLRGEIPTIRVELSVKDASRYRFTSSTKVSVSGFQSEVKSRSVLDGGDRLRVNIRLKKVTGPMGDITDYYWEGTVAQWSEVDDADRYEVRLYRGNTLVKTISVNQNQFDFYPSMTKAGEYTFRVRALSSLDDQKGKWTDKSEESSITKSDIYTGPASGNSGQNTSSPAGWQQDNRGWIYRQADGTVSRSKWLYVDNSWFYMADNSYMETGWLYVDNNWFYLNPISDGTRGAMRTGWQFVDNNWFYLNPISDGTKGAMKTGWQHINNSWFYLNPVSDGTRGAMRTGYQNINNQWYYLDPGSGVLWTNRSVPNGSVADSNGVLH